MNHYSREQIVNIHEPLLAQGFFIIIFQLEKKHKC